MGKESYFEKVDVSITQHLPHAILVRTADGKRGIIRARELSWDKDYDWRNDKNLAPGNKISAVRTGKTEESEELSLRLVEKDPWSQVAQKYSLNQRVSGTVENVYDYEVFIEIEDGVTGRLYYRDLPDGLANNYDLSTCFWPGDQVYTVITDINFTKREIGLSLKKAWAKRLVEIDSTISPYQIKHSPAELNQPKLLAINEISPRIVAIVEDDESQRNSIGRWLEHSIHEIHKFGSAEDFLAWPNLERCDVLICDVGLPGKDGIDLVIQVSENYPHIILALMTDIFRINQSDRIAAMIEAGHGVLCKPLLPNDIAEFLLNIDSEKPNGQNRDQKTISKQIADRALEDTEFLRLTMGQLLRQTYGESIILFAFDPLTRQVTVKEHLGKIKFDFNRVSELAFSPVRDAADGKEDIYIDDVKKKEKYSEKLYSFIKFGSCIGVPVETLTELNYTLFIFHREPGFLVKSLLDTVHLGANRIGKIIDQQAILDRFQPLQRLAILGNLASAMIHEMNHKLTPTGFIAEGMEEQLLSVQTNLTSSDLDFAKEELQESINDVKLLSENIRGLIRTAKLFGELSSKSADSLEKIEDIIDDVVWSIGEYAYEFNVDIYWEKPEKIHLAYANRSELQQVLLNVLFNAIQQIDAMRIDKLAYKGRIDILLTYETVDEKRYVEISISDNGPGIHKVIWKRIFSFGYTLGRIGGSGLGLFISRILINSLRGTIFVRESCRLWGTTFVVRLPATLKG